MTCSTAGPARAYYGDGDELHLVFNFPPLHVPWEAAPLARALDDASAAFDARDAWPCWVLSNHDQPRHRSRYGGSEARARAAAVLLLTLRGTPCLYAGEELGLLDADVPADASASILAAATGRGRRSPGTASRATAGRREPWLPWPPEPAVRNVAAEDADPESVLALYRRLLAAAARSRRAHAAGLAAAGRRPRNPRLRARGAAPTSAVSPSTSPATPATGVPPHGDWDVELTSTRGGATGPGTARFAAEEAVILRRRR